jgi:hypothetical protein
MLGSICRHINFRPWHQRSDLVKPPRCHLPELWFPGHRPTKKFPDRDTAIQYFFKFGFARINQREIRENEGGGLWARWYD